MSVTVRPYIHGVDWGYRIAQKHLEIRRWQESTGQNLFADIYDSRADLQSVLHSYLLPGGGFYVALDEDAPDYTPVGFVGMKRIDGRTAEVKRFAVDPAYQGQGIGTALMRMLLEGADDRGVEVVQLLTGQRERGRSLYERLGFQVVGRSPLTEQVVRAGGPEFDWVMQLDMADYRVQA